MVGEIFNSCASTRTEGNRSPARSSPLAKRMVRTADDLVGDRLAVAKLYREWKHEGGVLGVLCVVGVTLCMVQCKRFL